MGLCVLCCRNVLQADGALLCSCYFCISRWYLHGTKVQCQPVHCHCPCHHSVVRHLLCAPVLGLAVRSVSRYHCVHRERNTLATFARRSTCEAGWQIVVLSASSTIDAVHPPDPALCSRPVRGQSGQHVVCHSYRAQTSQLSSRSNAAHINCRHAGFNPPINDDDLALPSPRIAPMGNGKHGLGILPVLIPGSRKERSTTSPTHDDPSRQRRRAGRGDASLDRMGEHAGRVDVIPTTEKGRIENAVCGLDTTLVLALGPASNILVDLLWSSIAEGWTHHPDEDDAPGFLCCDDRMAYRRSLHAAAGRQTGSVGGPQCSHRLRRIRRLLGLVFLATHPPERHARRLFWCPAENRGWQPEEETVKKHWVAENYSGLFWCTKIPMYHIHVLYIEGIFSCIS